MVLALYATLQAEQTISYLHKWHIIHPCSIPCYAQIYSFRLPGFVRIHLQYGSKVRQGVSKTSKVKSYWEMTHRHIKVTIWQTQVLEGNSNNALSTHKVNIKQQACIMQTSSTHQANIKHKQLDKHAANMQQARSKHASGNQQAGRKHTPSMHQARTKHAPSTHKVHILNMAVGLSAAWKFNF